MNKTELIEEISSKCGLSKAAAGRALDAMIDAVIREVSKGGSVSLIGFGTFSAASRAARDVRNPQNGEKIHVEETVVPKFKAGTKFREAVAEGSNKGGKKKK